jgi:hypothetical protein
MMFGGLTHQPAVDLTMKLIALTPTALQQVFFCDSGSVAVEVAIWAIDIYDAALYYSTVGTSGNYQCYLQDCCPDFYWLMPSTYCKPLTPAWVWMILPAEVNRVA